MTPEQLAQFETMQRTLESLVRVENVPFIENSKRRIATPVLGESLQKDSTGTTTGTTQAVNEGGVGAYTVPAEFDGTITIEDADGNTYKLGYYTA